MKRTHLLPLVIAASLFSLASCADTPADPTAAKAASAATRRSIGKQRVVMFPEVRGETVGIGAEHAWTDAQFPGSQWSSRDVLEDSDGRVYHRVLLVNARRHEVTIYFDVTNWFDQL